MGVGVCLQVCVLCKCACALVHAGMCVLVCVLSVRACAYIYICISKCGLEAFPLLL